MKTASTVLRLLLAGCLAFPAACASTPEGALAGSTPGKVKTSPLPGERLRLSFEPVEANPGHSSLRREETEAVLTAMHAAFLTERPQIRLISPALTGSAAAEVEGPWQSQLRESFVSRFGGTLLPVPEAMERSRLFRALALSPRYMGAGVREAAEELFNSPLFVASVCMSVLVYFAAWLAPEPLFSKAFAATVTGALALAVGMFEVSNLALACLRLYREAEAARTEEELRAASERFGKAVGGTALRVLVLVASFGVGKALPTPSPGGAWAMMGPPRYSVEGGLVFGASATAQVVAQGSLIVSGVAAGEVATRFCGGLAMCATTDDLSGGDTPALSTRYGPPHTRQNRSHNEAIERELSTREGTGHTDLRKNRAQVNGEGKPVLDPEPQGGPHFRRPDASSLRPDGVRHNTNYVSNSRDLKRELEAFEAMKRADLEAIHELYLLDGMLLRRHVPRGVSFP
ncbi:MAG TPA: hypothetical protein VK539_38770 [Myxococcaceae bacterium]|nr:hypothetical protein [Myxococcaceae bacterium]